VTETAHRKPRGFTIIEVLIALSIFLLGVAAILVLFPLGIRQTRDVIQDARASLATIEAVSTLKTIGAAEKIYADYNNLAPSDWTRPNLSPPWHFPRDGALLMPGSPYTDGKEVFPVFDGEGGKTEYSYEVIIYPAGYDWDSGAGAPAADGFFRRQGLYNCQVVVYWKYDSTKFVTGTVDAARNSDTLTINSAVDKTGATIQQGDYKDYFREGRYIQVDVKDASGNDVPGLWFKIVGFDPATNTVTLDRPFYSIGPGAAGDPDQDPTNPNQPFPNRAFRLSTPESRVIRTTETMITASGTWRPS